MSDSARELSRGFYTERETESAIRYVFGVDSQLVADATYLIVETETDLLGCGGWSRRRTLYGGDRRPVGEQTFSTLIAMLLEFAPSSLLRRHREKVWDENFSRHAWTLRLRPDFGSSS